jgi:hypothetical protein
MNGQSMMGVCGADKRAPGNGPQTEFLHDAPDTFFVDGDPAALQRACNTAVTVAGKFALNTFDLMTKLFILVADGLLMLFVWPVVEAAGGQSTYFAGFRN